MQELTQLDVEMAFPDLEYIFALIERIVAAGLARDDRRRARDAVPADDVAEAMLRYGSDKPDLRFGLEIQDATEVTRGSEFGVFAGAPAVRFLSVPQELSRAEVQKLEEIAKEWGAKGLAYIVSGEDGEVALADREVPLAGGAGAFGEPGTTVLFGADDAEIAARARRAAPPPRPRARA